MEAVVHCLGQAEAKEGEKENLQLQFPPCALEMGVGCTGVQGLEEVVVGWEALHWVVGCLAPTEVQ